MQPKKQENINVKFYTKAEKYSIPDTIISIPTNSSPEDLSQLINSTLEEDKPKWKTVNFDFIVKGDFLRIPIDDYIIQKGLSTLPEDVLEVEYVRRPKAPSPEESISLDDWVSAIRVNEDKILSGTYDNKLHLWTTSGENVFSIEGHEGPIKGVSWVGPNRFVSVSIDQTAKLWEWKPKDNVVNCINVYKGHARSVDCVAVNKQGTKFATGSYDKMLKIWSTESTENSSDPPQEKRRKMMEPEPSTETPIVTIAGHNEPITTVNWTSDFEICTASLDHTIRFWNIELGGVSQVLNGTKAFFDVSISPVTNLVLSASADRHIRLWDRRDKESLVSTVFTSHNGWVSCLNWSNTSEHHFISGSYDNLLKFWDVRSSRSPLYDLAGHTDKVLCCDWSNPALVVSGSSDCHMKIFKSGITAK